MRISRIEIERFLGIKRASLRVTPSLQLIAGPNNAGKTTIMKAIEFFFSISGSKTELRTFVPKNKYYLEEGPRSLTSVRMYFSDLTEEEKDVFGPAINPRNDTFWCEVRVSRKGKVSFEASRDQIGNEVHSSIVDRYSLVHIPVLRVGDSGVALAETKRFATAVREILVRQRPGKESETQKEFQKRYRKLKELVQSILNESKQAAETLLPTNSEIEFEIPEIGSVLDGILEKTWIKTRKETDLTLREEGTGYQSLLSLGLLSYAAEKAGRRGQNMLFLVEEPEAFLHPQYQRAVAEFLSSISEQSQVFVTTHSPTIIDATEVTGILRLVRMPEGLEVEWDPPTISDVVAGQLFRYCDAKNSELIFSDRVVLCEGISDAGVVRELIRRRLRLDQNRENISVIDMQSRDNAPSFVELLLRFEIPFLLVLDKDLYTGDRNTLKKVAKVQGIPIEINDNSTLDDLKARRCESVGQANQCRDLANALLLKWKIFTWSSDIEGAVIGSFRKEQLLAVLGPGNLEHLSAESVAEIGGLSGNQLHKRFQTLMGSKGWNGEKAKKDRKPKPHVLPQVIKNGSLRAVRNSDVTVITRRLREFLAPIQRTLKLRPEMHSRERNVEEE